MSKKKSSIGCLFWIALILLVLVIFLFSRKRIENVLETTGFMNFITREAPEEDREAEPATEEESRPTADTPTELPASSAETVEETGTTESSEPVIIVEPVPEPSDSESGGASSSTQDEPAAGVEKRFRRSRLYYVGTDENDEITLQGIIRPVYYTDSPLTETLRSLLAGLSPSELNKGLITLIPEGTDLLGVAVRDGVAYVDFNENFRFNTLGREGYLAQLKQVVYTSTEFGTVNSVQILIDGKRHTYLGPEGVFIGDPLNREAFN